MNVYFRDRANKGKLAVIAVDEEACKGSHEEAILMVQGSLVEAGTGYDDPVLALIHGGKQ